MAGNTRNTPGLTVKNVFLDTNQELMAYMPRECYACRLEGTCGRNFTIVCFSSFSASSKP
jgi:hypothetical protein